MLLRPHGLASGPLKGHLNPLITIPTVATLAQDGWQSLNISHDFHDQPAPYLPGQYSGRLLDNLRQINFMSNFR